MYEVHTIYIYTYMFIYIYIYIYTYKVHKFPEYFRMGTFIDSTHMKL